MDVYMTNSEGVVRPVCQGPPEPTRIIRLSYHYSLVIDSHPLPLLINRAAGGAYTPGWAGDETDEQKRQVKKLILAQGMEVYRTK